jgi:hypothetical protein
MKVAYVFATDLAHKLLSTMIVPQLEAGRHGAEVVGMFFLVDNVFYLQAGNDLGERLNALAGNSGMLLMGCDQCCYERGIAGKLVERAAMGCFPDLYAALGEASPDQVITL